MDGGSFITCGMIRLSRMIWPARRRLKPRSFSEIWPGGARASPRSCRSPIRNIVVREGNMWKRSVVLAMVTSFVVGTALAQIGEQKAPKPREQKGRGDKAKVEAAGFGI